MTYGILALLVPIIAIVGGIWAGNESSKRKALAKGQSPEDRALLSEIKLEQQALQVENLQLKERLTNLETIITGIDESLLLPSAKAAMDNPQRKVKELSKRIES
ncbi:hypothetical protein N8482_02910 [Chitinophagales bacterium]|nr:hypothetical protein [Chitinophagales bacterium]